MPENTLQLAGDINCIAAYLAQDDFAAHGLPRDVPNAVDVIALLGNQVIATLTAACELAQRAPETLLLFSGGVGHSTRFLFENLRASPYAALIQDASINQAMAEAEMYAVVAKLAFAIPASRILVENRSRNAGENARFSLRALNNAQARHSTTLILQDPTMQRRSMLTWAREADLANVQARTLSHPAFVPKVQAASQGALRLTGDQSQGTWTFERFLALILGEIPRLRDDEEGYGPRGRNFLPHVDIPEPVLQSYKRVAASPLAAMAMR